ncbi:MAG: glutamate--tRNA ligase [Blastochloris viridis]|uniref:Glutamate--tRNA ligase n=1 Tax=Blastochloris viridis TaxID=1079 RepID=A0A6N4R773_BLAVI|nr:MAG: glutamate--tRNA ligase [Blastochloris viridis]
MPTPMTLRDCTTIVDLEALFPPRTNLPQGAEVTRIAPSPTGMPHIGTAMQAVLDRAIADKTGGIFILRIEDTDRARTVEGAVDAINAGLKWLGTTPDEGPLTGGAYGPYTQSERLPIYAICCDKLLADGHAYRCFCTPERLEQMRALQMKQKMPSMYDRRCLKLSAEEIQANLDAGLPHVVRMKIPSDQDITITDAVRGDITFHSSTIDDSVIMKADGYPTYHLAAVVDDHFMRTTTVVRGEEWIPSTPKHVLLYKAFGWQAPRFLHTVLLRDMEKRKLSKRSGDTSLNWFRREGFLSQGFTNFLTRIMWAHPEGKDVYPRSEFAALMQPEGLPSTGPIVDIKLLQFINNAYINAMTDAERKDLLEEYLTFLSDTNQTASTCVEPGLPSDEISIDTIRSMLTEIRNDPAYTAKVLSVKPGRYDRLADMILSNLYFFDATFVPATKEAFLKQADAATLQQVLETFLQDFTARPDHASDVMADMIAGGLGKKQVFMPLRLALTGQEKSPPPEEIIPVMGAERVIQRLQAALAIVKA